MKGRGRATDKPKTSPEPPPDLTNAALKSATSLMGLQAFSRFISFALNQALVRLATPDVYGTVSIQLELLLNTILFLSREGFRNALLRADSPKDSQTSDSPLVSNLSLLPLYLGVPVSVLTSASYLQLASLETKSQSFFRETVALYTLAAVLELVSEPMHIKSVQRLDSSLRVRAEGLAVVVRSIVTVGTLAYDARASKGSGTLSLLAFALGQLAYSLALLAVYWKKYGVLTNLTIKRPKSTRNESHEKRIWSFQTYFDTHLLDVSLAMTLQGIVKHALTEGDKVIISAISPLKDQGGYAVANNYGALIARMILQPIEETSRLYFSKALSTKAINKQSFEKALSRLSFIIFIYNHVALLLIAFGPPYLPIALALILSPRYLNTSAPILLQAWIFYIPVLATNGILEAFVSSVATPADLGRQSRWMAGASVAYILLTIGLYSLAGLGDTAVVYANIANLSARIAYCTSFISRKSRASGGMGIRLSGVLPSKTVIAVATVAAGATRLSSYSLGISASDISSIRSNLISTPHVIHVGVGIVSVLFTLAACVISERELFDTLFNNLRQRKKVE